MEVSETGIPSKYMVYVGSDEAQLLDRLFRVKLPTATYYNTKDGGKVVAYHWLLNPITLRKMKIDFSVVKLRPE